MPYQVGAVVLPAVVGLIVWLGCLRSARIAARAAPQSADSKQNLTSRSIVRG